ncbi:MAG TPA: SDR family NAD(P)-dependent oxidoreductase, partial [Chitinophagaceae bacterium]|nr:SDR family NAD(P)-dependent oxidoreductase [Chitinophagaceae bacterium]
MDLGLKNRVAFIAASSKGLGKSVALELSREGATTIINGRNKEELEKTKKEIEGQTDAKVLAIAGDLSIEAERNRIITSTLQAFSKIDILVTNTGGPPTGRIEELKKEDWDHAYNNLLASVVALVNGFLPGMKQQLWGRIISITSITVKQPVNNLLLSNSVRAAVTGLMKTLANELGMYNITVNNALPGYTETERLKDLISNNPSFASVKNEIPLARFGTPGEFAAAVA